MSRHLGVRARQTYSPSTSGAQWLVENNRAPGGAPGGPRGTVYGAFFG